MSYSPDHRFWWDGQQWVPVPQPQVVAAVATPEGRQGSWDGSRWHGPLPPPPIAKGHRARTASIIVVGFMLLAFASGVASIEHHDNLGGWTVSVGGYSCWFSPGDDSSKTYCGRDGGFFHIPVRLA